MRRHDPRPAPDRPGVDGSVNPVAARRTITIRDVLTYTAGVS
jgi:CubicO group peptidase (beta-lactamase class C family)